MTAPFRIEPLGDHNRKDFSCDVPVLNRYIREQASQDIRRRVSNYFVAIDAAGTVAAFYTFAANTVPLTELAPSEVKRLPRYGLLPAGLIGRLAVDSRFKGQRLGSALIMDAVRRATRSDPAIYALLVEAKDDAAASFYRHLGFRSFSGKPMTLFLPVETALKALEGGE